MPLPRLVLGSLLLSLPLASQAQGTEPAPYRFYVGLAAYSSYYQPLGGGGYRPTRVPLQLTAGYQWRPRLAVQVGVAYSSTSEKYFNTGYTFNGTSTVGTFYSYQGSYVQSSSSVSVLARYTLTRQPAHRVQFDLVGGLTLEHSGYRNYGTSADSVQHGLNTSPYDERYSDNGLVLCLGPSVRYRFGQRLELTYDFLLNKNLSGQYYPNTGLTSSAALGLRYRFGRR